MTHIKNKILAVTSALAFLALYVSPAMALTFTEIQQAKVLGNVEYAPVRLNSIFTTFKNISVKAKDFSDGKWKFVIDWSRVRNAHGSIYILPVGQSEPVYKLDDVNPQDSAETGYVFNPQARYKLEFYSDINKGGKLLLRKFFTTLKAPEIACLQRPVCMDANPPCLPAEPMGGWCLSEGVNITTNDSLTLAKGDFSKIAFKANSVGPTSGDLYPVIDFAQTGNVPGMTFGQQVPCKAPAGLNNLNWACPAIAVTLDTAFLRGTPTTAGSYTITITAKDQYGHTGTKSFTVVVAEKAGVSDAPVISSITPTIGAVGTMITLKGTGFYEGSRVSFGNSSLGSQSSVAKVVDGQIKFVIPRQIIPPGPNCPPPMYCVSPAPREVGLGDYVISVSNDFGTSNQVTFTVNSLTFAVCDYAAPPTGCSYINGPGFNPVTQCGMVLSCANSNVREP